MPSYDWERPLKDLKELAELTGGPDGARRLAWSEDWRTAREWLLGKLEETDATVERDVAGNLWATIPGESDKIVVVGSHIDAVPTAAGSTAASGLLAAVEVLRAHEGETPPVTLKLVDWADEEGARFGRSLLGSSAAAGTLDPDAVRHLKDNAGHRAPGRARRERRRPRHDGRGRAAGDRRLPGAAHRAGPAPGGGRQARRGRDRLLRRRAPQRSPSPARPATPAAPR